MFEFMGKLMGIAVCQKNYMDINLSPIVWKKIVGEHVTMVDYSLVNKMDYDRWLCYKSMSPEDFETIRKNDLDPYFDGSDATFTALSLGGQLVELHVGGSTESVTKFNLKQYCDELEEFRIHELDQVTAAVRRGLLTQLNFLLLCSCCLNGAILRDSFAVIL
jgi:hypothetical protein